MTRLVDHAELEHGDGEIVSAWADGTVTRTDWPMSPGGGACPGVEGLGIKPGDASHAEK